MKRKALRPIPMGRRSTRRSGQPPLALGQIILLGMLSTSILFVVSLGLVMLHQPHIWQGDANWDEVGALMIPAALAAAITGSLILAYLVHALRLAIAALGRIILPGLVATRSAAGRVWRTLVLRPWQWVAASLRAALAWAGAVIIRPTRRRLSYILRVMGAMVARVLLHHAWPATLRLLYATRTLLLKSGHTLAQLAAAWVIGPTRMAAAAISAAIRTVATRLFQVYVRPLARLLWVAFSRLTGLLCGAAAWMLLHSGRFIWKYLFLPLAAAGRGLGWLAARLMAGARWVRVAIARALALAMKGAGRLARYLWRASAWVLGQALGGLVLAARAAYGVGSVGFHAGQSLLRALLHGFLATRALLLRSANALARWAVAWVVNPARLAAQTFSAALRRAGSRVFHGYVQPTARLVSVAFSFLTLKLSAWLTRGGQTLAQFTTDWVIKPARLAVAWLSAALKWTGNRMVQGFVRPLTRVLAASLRPVRRAAVWATTQLGFALSRILTAILRGSAWLSRKVLAASGLMLGLALRGLRVAAAAALHTWYGSLSLARALASAMMRRAAHVRGHARFVSVAVLIVVAGFYLGGQSALAPLACRLGVQSMCPASACAAPDESVVVRFYSSNTKENWVDVATAAFNAHGYQTAAGNPIFVCVTHGTSGGQQQELRDGAIQPTAWSPGDQSWVDGINQVWRDRHGQPLVRDACRPTVFAPIGFAMWRPMAEAMGWPDQPIGWDQFVALAADPQGWGRYGHPEWGPFKLGHTHPDHSNSGLLVLAALAHDVLEQSGALTVDQVLSPEFETALRKVEQHTYHYGIQSRDLINAMVSRGTDYLHAINTTEAEVLRTNLRRAAELPQPLAFIFPASGTFWTEQPYCVLHAEWTTDEQREAARIFGDYLLEPEQQALAPENYLRPVNPAIPLGALFSLDNGTDPRVTTEQVPALESPSPDISALIRDVFHRAKKKATVVILLDVSGSMRGAKMTGAVEATITFLTKLNRDDEVFIFAFGDAVSEIGAGGLARATEETLTEELRALTASGGTALYDALCQGSQRIEALRAADAAAGEQRLYGMVLLSDGEDTTSSATNTEMVRCLPEPESGDGIKVFTVMYGKDADTNVLGQIASQTLGKTFEAEAGTISDVYLAISAEQ